VSAELTAVRLEIDVMQIGSGEFRYEWLEHWARIPDTETGRANGRTHGVVVAGNGDLFVFSQAQPGVLRFGPDGRLKNAWGDRFAGAHGMTLTMEGDAEFLWLTDQASSEVVKCTLDGKSMLSLQRPPVPVYEGNRRFVPTWVAVHEERFGGNGDVWVADGYGAHFVHRYTRSGAYVSSINGTEGAAGAFACPHGIAFIPRPGGTEMYIADRGNKRVQVYDAEGRFKRVIGREFLHSPCGFAHRNGFVYIPELWGRLTIIDPDDKLLTYIGDNPGVEATPGWPNLTAEQIHPGRFNSPHGMAVNANGDLYVGEWIIGGRVTKLTRV